MAPAAPWVAPAGSGQAQHAQRQLAQSRVLAGAVQLDDIPQ
jgi:hypothetical protein